MNNKQTIIASTLARTCSATADQVLLFCIPIIIFQKTGSIKASGLAYALEWVPRLASLLVSGVVVDRICPKRVAVYCDLLRSGLCLLGLFFSLTEGFDSFIIYAVLAGIIGIFYETSFLSFDVLLSRYASKSQLPRVQSLVQGIEQFSLVAGPAVAAFIFTQWGIARLFGAAAVLFLVSALVLGRFRLTGNTPSRDLEVKTAGRVSTFFVQIKNGFYRIAVTPQLRLLTLLGFCLNFALGVAISTSPGVLSQTLKLPSEYFGIMNTIAGAFSILVFVIVARFRLMDSLGKVSVVSCTSCVAGAFGLAFSQSAITFIAAFSFLLAGDGALGVVIRSTRARLVPVHELGVTTSAMMLILLSALPISGFTVSLWPSGANTISLMAVSAGLSAIASFACLPMIFLKQSIHLSKDEA